VTGLKRFFSVNSLTELLNKYPVLKKALLVILAISLLANLGLIRLGTIKTVEENTLTVVGSYTTEESNKIATYVATISGQDTDKEKLSDLLNVKSSQLINDLKEFGIDMKDIETTNNYIYEIEDPEVLKRYRVGQTVWEAGTSLEIILRDVEKVSDLSTLLTSMDKVEIYGPTYSLDEKDQNQAFMLSRAVDDAKEKARFVSKEQKKLLGKMIRIEELSGQAFTAYGDVLGFGGGGSTDFAPGTTRLIKTVKVTFKLY